MTVLKENFKVIQDQKDTISDITQKQRVTCTLLIIWNQQQTVSEMNKTMNDQQRILTEMNQTIGDQ